MIVTTYSSQDTEAFGARLAGRLAPNAVLTCSGRLGAGKTTLVRGICAGLGADPEAVSSPTFVLLQIYQGRLPIYHFDAYRLRGPGDFSGIGADDYLEGDGVCLIEWPERVWGCLPDDRLDIRIESPADECRELTLQPTGPRSRDFIEGLA